MKQRISMRYLTFLLLALMVAALARPSHAQDYCDPNYSFLAPGAPALTLYQVADPSHIVVMEYMPWLGPNAYHLTVTTGVPRLASLPGFDGMTYDTADCRVQGQHVAWMLSMGVDAILLDLTNVGQCVFAHPGEPDSGNCDDTNGDLQRAPVVLDNVAKIFEYYKKHNVPIRIIPLIDAQDSSVAVYRYPDQKTGFQRALEFFQSYSSAANYQNNMVWYQGKPLLAMYTGTPYAAFGNLDWLSVVANQINVIGMHDAFTYRFVTGTIDSQAPLWDDYPNGQIAGLHRLAVAGLTRPIQDPQHPFIPYPIWSWIDRISADLTTLAPTYSVATVGGRPENFTVTTAFYGTDCFPTGLPPPNPQCGDPWPSHDTRGRGDTTSTVLDDFMNKANVLQPRFLIVHQFNEFGQGGDEGSTRALTNDIEPTSSVNGGPGWGTDYVSLFTTKIGAYKNSLTRPSALSTRLWVGTGDNIGIGGFTIAGPGPKKVLIRGRGPSLGFGSAGLTNPTLLLLSGSTVIASNDDWGQASNSAEIQALGPPGDPHESAIAMTLNPGNYTVFLQGVGGGTGIGLVEVYEIDNPGSPLSGLSTRGYVGLGNSQMISSFAIGGTQPQRVLIRVQGPTLAQAGVAGVLVNPTLTLLAVPSNAVVASNDDWQQAANATDIQALGAPGDSREPAILITLNPGVYSAIVSGVGGTQGVALPTVVVE